MQQKSRKISAPGGSMVLLIRKSSRSSIPVPGPSGWKADQTLKPRMQGSTSSAMAAPLTRVDFLRLQPHTSIL